MEQSVSTLIQVEPSGAKCSQVELSEVNMEQKGSQMTAKEPNIQKAFNRFNLLLNWYDLDSSFLLNVSKVNLNIVKILCELVDPDQIFEYNEIINRYHMLLILLII